MKITVTLPVALVRAADPLARRLGKSRSALVSSAVAEYVARHEGEAVTRALDQLAQAIGTRMDSTSTATARRLLERNEW